MKEHAIFDLDNPVMQKLQGLADLLLAGILALAFSLPIVTIGPALAALYYTVVKVVRHDRGTVWQCFLSSFKDNLKHGIPLTILYGGCYLLIGMFLSNMSREGSAGHLYLVSGVILIPAVLFTSVYIFPILSRYNMTISKQIVFAVSMAVGHFPTTLTLSAMLAAAIALIWMWGFSLLLVPAIFTYAASFLIERVFRNYYSDELKRKAEEGGEDLPWYLETKKTKHGMQESSCS